MYCCKCRRLIWAIPLTVMMVICLHIFISSSVPQISSLTKQEVNLSNFHKSLQNPQRIIYNRVGKSGSTTTLQLIKQMASVNGFYNHVSRNYSYRMLSSDNEISHLVEDIIKLPTPMLYDRHLYYINFSNYVSDQPPVYINIIRDPVEMFISRYFYVRFSSPTPFKGPDKLKYLSLRDCLHGQYWECQNTPPLAMPFFCGQHDHCRMKDTISLGMAFDNLEAYAVVGVLERYEEFLYVLECLLPSYFSGIQKAYRDSKGKRKNVGHHKEELSQEDKDLLRERLSLDYILYDEVYSRFTKLFSEVREACHVKKLF